MKTVRNALVVLLWCFVGCGSEGDGEDCTPNARTICKDGVTYWTDSCGNQGDLAETCECGCNADYSGCEDCGCTPACDVKECGPDGCDGTCPPGCGAGEFCNQDGQCESCTQSCSGTCCGDDGCGDTCPDNCAATGQTCNTETCACEGECQPSDCADLGKECGTWDDGCDGTVDCGGCPDGQVCDENGQCEGDCIPSCDGKECGDDGCGEECGTCMDGWACSNEGNCIVAECGGDPLTIQGALRTNAADVQFDTVDVSIYHKRDIDEYEDGCITRIEITLTYGSGCQLHVIASGRYLWQGGLAVSSVEFSADSFCPNFPDPTEGTYMDTGGMVVAEILPGVTEVPGYNVPESCVATTLTIRLEGALTRWADGAELVVLPTEIVVYGEFLSAGDTMTSCPCLPNCGGKECGDDGCGGKCGSCPGMTDYCTADGHCLDDCQGRLCGPSPNAGHDCGTCGVNNTCNNGQCECTYETCGGGCCSQVEVCYSGTCCTPDCNGKECGPDGCGSTCLPGCGAGTTCNEVTGRCEPDPDIDVVEPSLTDGIYQLNFGNVQVGVTVSNQVVLANVGGTALRIIQLNFEMGTDVEDFSIPQEIIDSLPLVVAPGEETFFDVVYTATDGRTDHGILDMISNDPDEPMVQIHLLSEFKGDASAAVAPQALPFGDVPVGDASLPLTFTIANQGTGNAVLSVDDVQTGILNNPNFNLTITDSGGGAVTLPALLNNSDFLDVEVVFLPQQAGPYSDNVLVLTDDANNPSITVEISGRGVVGDLVVEPSPIAIGKVRVDTFVDVPVTLRNSGGASLSLTAIVLQNASPEFTLSSNDLDLADLPNNPSELVPAESVVLLLSFDPVDIGLEEAVLVIDNTSPDAQRSVAVSAEGYIPASVETNPDPPNLNFGDVQLDLGTGITETATMIVEISNVGGEPLEIFDIQLSIGNQDYWFEPATISPIDVNLAVPLYVSYTPTQFGLQHGSILVDTNDPSIALDGVVGRFKIEMQANGIDPNMTIIPESKDFLDVYVGMVVSQVFTIQNLGLGPLEIHAIELTAGSSGSFTLPAIAMPNLPVVVINPMTITFEVQYMPASLGFYQGAVRVVSSDIGNPSQLLGLTGVGVGCEVNYLDCNGDPQDGCEIYCSPTGNEQCNYLDDDCDCETDEDFELCCDVFHCGFCGNACTYPNAVPDCVDGFCELSSCIPPWANCNGLEGDGCEVHTDSDVDHCGACNNACFYPNASASCLGGTCVMGPCHANFLNCNGEPADGCEVDKLFDVNNCGTCGSRCLFPHATGVCSGGICFLGNCDQNYANCNFIASDGCEISLMGDPNNCSSCGRVCPDPGGPAECQNGACGYEYCNSDFADCNNDGIDCETNIFNDPNNCGGCGNNCIAGDYDKACVNDSGTGRCGCDDDEDCGGARPICNLVQNTCQ